MNYPHDATNESRLIVEIVRDGKVFERRVEFLNATWTVQGLIQHMLFGEPQTASQFSTTSIAERPALSEEKALDVLEHLAGDNKDHQRALAIPPEIWQGLWSWIIRRLMDLFPAS